MLLYVFEITETFLVYDACFILKGFTQNAEYKAKTKNAK